MLTSHSVKTGIFNIREKVNVALQPVYVLAQQIFFFFKRLSIYHRDLP